MIKISFKKHSWRLRNERKGSVDVYVVKNLAFHGTWSIIILSYIFLVPHEGIQRKAGNQSYTCVRYVTCQISFEPYGAIQQNDSFSISTITYYVSVTLIYLILNSPSESTLCEQTTKWASSLMHSITFNGRRERKTNEKTIHLDSVGDKSDFNKKLCKGCRSWVLM